MLANLENVIFKILWGSMPPDEKVFMNQYFIDNKAVKTVKYTNTLFGILAKIKKLKNLPETK